MGHRPGAQNVHGETAFGGVSHTLESDRPPGQGWSVDTRSTTSYNEVGREYKPHTRSDAEAFRSAVSGVKSGYAGHTPGAREHFGSSHQGGVPLDDFRAAQPEARESVHVQLDCQQLQELLGKLDTIQSQMDRLTQA